MTSLKTLVEPHAGNPDLRAELLGLYADLAEQVRSVQPRCEASGRCCHFVTYGHRLYITTAELACFWGLWRRRGEDDSIRSEYAKMGKLVSLSQVRADLTDLDACPLLKDGLCSVHEIRPFGCRIFYCDPSAEPWMSQAYEQFHAKIIQLHSRYGIEYRYVEWRQALTELEIMSPDP